MASCWSGRRGSNSLPPPWQGGALPDELRPHIRCIFPCTLPSDSCEFRGPRESLRSKILWGRGGISEFVTAVLLVRLPDKRLTFRRATRIGLEPTTPSVTGWCSNQLSYRAMIAQVRGCSPPERALLYPKNDFLSSRNLQKPQKTFRENRKSRPQAENGQNKTSGTIAPDVYGRGSKSRTYGTRFWRPLLYQLSYTPRSVLHFLNA